MNIRQPLLIMIIILGFGSIMSCSDFHDHNLSDIYTRLDTCLPLDVKDKIKDVPEVKWSKDGLAANELDLTYNEVHRYYPCFSIIDTVINNDNKYKEYLSDLLLEPGFNSSVREIIEKNYHKYLNGRKYDFDRDMDSLREIKRWSDSLDLAWKSADTIMGYYIPVNLDDAFIHMTDLFIDSDIENFKNDTNEVHAVYSEYFGMGLRLRNAWKPSGSRLSKYFAPYELYNADSISVIIFAAWHRYLNHKPINIDEIISKYHKKIE